MPDSPTRIVTAAEAPHLRAAMQELGGGAWPEFLLHSAVVNRHWDQLYEVYPECQFALLASDQALLAIGNSLPVRWDGPQHELPERGVEWALESRFAVKAPDPPDLLCAIQIVVAPAQLNSGKSAIMVSSMRKVAESCGLRHLIAPVRPIWKHRYPLVPMERYVRWTREDGLPYDPWMRVHTRLGATTAQVCAASVVIRGDRAAWAHWTGMHFPESGDYVVPGGLVSMSFDAGRDEGLYVEPNIWMVHP